MKFGGPKQGTARAPCQRRLVKEIKLFVLSLPECNTVIEPLNMHNLEATVLACCFDFFLVPRHCTSRMSMPSSPLLEHSPWLPQGALLVQWDLCNTQPQTYVLVSKSLLSLVECPELTWTPASTSECIYGILRVTCDGKNWLSRHRRKKVQAFGLWSCPCYRRHVLAGIKWFCQILSLGAFNSEAK